MTAETELVKSLTVQLESARTVAANNEDEHLAWKNKALELQEKLTTARAALIYYGSPCPEGCANCNHLIARTALKEISK